MTTSARGRAGIAEGSRPRATWSTLAFNQAAAAHDGPCWPGRDCARGRPAVDFGPWLCYHCRVPPDRPPARGSLKVAQRLAGLRADLVFALVDAVLTICSYLIVRQLAQPGRPLSHPWLLAAWLGAVVVVTIAINAAVGLYGRLWRYASVTEARQVVAAGIASGAVLAGMRPLLFPRIHLSVVLLGAGLTLVLVGATRFRSRLFAFRRDPSPRSGLRLAVIGSRDMAAAIIRDMLRFPGAGFTPVIVLEDDLAARGRSVNGVPIVGGIDSLPKLAERYQVHQVLLAVSSPPADLVRRAAAAAELSQVPIKMLPGMRELVNGHASIRQAREMRIEDLIGRAQVATDLEAVRRLIAGRRVLVTGGGGSIGSEIVRQAASCEPAALYVLDHDETHLHDVASTLSGSAVQVLADIREREELFELFESLRPDVVFHAAAHKHLPILERFPLEAARTNVLGTQNVVDAASAVGAGHVVFISTDKAVRPSSILGASKWLGEQVVLAHRPPGGTYCCVRFGNVLGSRGSVIPTFTRQIAAGGPVTVTDREMTRYFMSISEAVQLVLQAAVLAEGGELLVLDMGEAVNIFDLARRMIHLAGLRPGVDIEIELTGARPGEKQGEELRAPEEEVLASRHPAIARLAPVLMPPERLEAVLAHFAEIVALHDREAAAEALRAFVSPAFGTAGGAPSPLQRADESLRTSA